MATAEDLGQSQDNQTNIVGDETPPPPPVEGDTLEIEVVSDVPAEDQRPPRADADDNTGLTDDEVSRLSKKTQDRIAKLKYEFHEERRKKEAAERLASEAVEHTKRISTESQRAKGLLGETQKALADQTKKRAESAMADAETRLKIAQESGDHEGVTQATKDMTAAQMAQAYAGNTPQQVARKWAQDNPMQPVQDQPPQQQQQTENPPPNPRTLKWGDENKWFGPDGDVEMTSLAYGVHESLIRQGVDPESEAYFEGIDKRMREVFPSKFEGSNASPPSPTTSVDVTPQAAHTVVAPVTRNNGAVNAPSRKITLTATQVSLARKLGLTTEQYARQLVKEQSNV